jgi:hypothetical protein
LRSANSGKRAGRKVAGFKRLPGSKRTARRKAARGKGWKSSGCAQNDAPPLKLMY